MKLAIKNSTGSFVILILVFLTVIVTLYFYNARKIEISGKQVDHTQDVLHLSDRVLLEVLNVEIDLRGYLINGKANLLLPLSGDINTITRDVSLLKELTKDNVSQQKRINLLVEEIGYRTKYIVHAIKKGKIKPLEQSERLMAAEGGKLLTNQIRTRIEEIKGEEYRLLSLRRGINDRSNNMTGAVFFLLFILLLVILTLLLSLKRNQRFKNEHAVKLSRSNDLFSNLFNFSPTAIYIKHLSDGRIINVNQSFIDLFGFRSKEDVLGHVFAELDVFVDAHHGEEITRLLKQQNVVRDYVTAIKDRKGIIKWTSADLLILDIEGLPCILSVSTDITQRKKAEELLVATNKELEAFTYSVSHDLRAPLRAVNGYANILREDYGTQLGEGGLSSLNAILNNSKRMGQLIDDLLAFSRLGKKTMELSEINQKALVKSILEEEAIFQVQKSEITVDELIPCFGQQMLIRQVWVNLISNALKYSNLQAVSKVEIGSYRKGNDAVYFVKDNGVGFDMQYYDKLFGVFQRLHSQQEFEGTGIGLAIVKKIVNRHQGKVWAESILNKGACFYFSLPIINN